METSGNFFVELQKLLKIKTSKGDLYKEAFTHSSVNLKKTSGESVNFERLEFLGDAILDSIIAEILYHNYPDAKEGSLTKLRAKIVSRAKLNQIGKEMGLSKIAEIDNHHQNFGEDIHGNLLESLLGALFIDKGYLKTKAYVEQHVVNPYVDMDGLDTFVLSHKALLIEWGQKNKKQVEFKTTQVNGLNPSFNYSCQLLVEGTLTAKAKENSKKKAEEKAAKIAVRALKLNRIQVEK